MKQQRLATRIVLTLFGLMLVGAGCSMGIVSNLGVDPASVFELGLSNIFHISYGTAMSLTNLIILVIVLIVDRHYVNIATFLALFMVGFSADLFNGLFAKFLDFAALNMVSRVLFMVLGCVVMSFGIAIYIRTDLGVGAVDLVSEIISNKGHLPYKWVRIGGDFAFVIVGYFLGGVVGVGTIVTAFLTGPVVSWVRPWVFKVIDPMIKREARVPIKEVAP